MEDRNDGGEARQKLLFVYYQGGVDALAGEHRRIVDLNKKGYGGRGQIAKIVGQTHYCNHQTDMLKNIAYYNVEHVYSGGWCSVQC